ncbi:MAG: hypothetical protein M0D54_07860 [Hyphomonadaceae bacterium JAD_PAG50586_4]|nr:MAG: hypothetical protein M0D54_07860 [Hyphomonadaceae bacterium JAD_PAG50586_4]
MPDLHAPDTVLDFGAGIDRALDLALTHTTDAEANEIDEARISYCERPSQGVEWRPFWRS